MVTSRIWFTAAQKAELWERWKTGNAAGQVLKAAGELSQQADNLKKVELKTSYVRRFDDMAYNAASDRCIARSVALLPYFVHDVVLAHVPDHL